MKKEIIYQPMTIAMADLLGHIDRSEFIDATFQLKEGKLEELPAELDSLGWNTGELKQIQQQYKQELNQGGMAFGAFQEELLVGFGVLGNRFMAEKQDHLHVDLMYVSANFRRQGIGTVLLNMIGAEAKKRGAAYLYISSAETKSAVTFYQKNGSLLTEKVDEELYHKEPEDIHMIINLNMFPDI